jgi:hypothetical protein
MAQVWNAPPCQRHVRLWGGIAQDGETDPCDIIRHMRIPLVLLCPPHDPLLRRGVLILFRMQKCHGGQAAPPAPIGTFSVFSFIRSLWLCCDQCLGREFAQGVLKMRTVITVGKDYGSIESDRLKAQATTRPMLADNWFVPGLRFEIARPSNPGFRRRPQRNSPPQPRCRAHVKIYVRGRPPSPPPTLRMLT